MKLCSFSLVVFVLAIAEINAAPQSNDFTRADLLSLDESPGLQKRSPTANADDDLVSETAELILEKRSSRHVLSSVALDKRSPGHPELERRFLPLIAMAASTLAPMVLEKGMKVLGSAAKKSMARKAGQVHAAPQPLGATMQQQLPLGVNQASMQAMVAQMMQQMQMRRMMQMQQMQQGGFGGGFGGQQGGFGGGFGGQQGGFGGPPGGFGGQQGGFGGPPGGFGGQQGGFGGPPGGFDGPPGGFGGPPGGFSGQQGGFGGPPGGFDGPPGGFGGPPGGFGGQ